MDKITQSEIWERELSRRLGRPLLKRMIRARLDGKTKLNTASLARLVPALRGKRRSIQVACVAMALAGLRTQGQLPDWLVEEIA